jgi:hypothetical protein
MLNPKLTVSLLCEYLEFNDHACAPAMRLVDRHGENNALNYFFDAHQIIGHKEWKKCLDYLAKHPITAELLHECDEFYLVGLKSSKGPQLSALPLMKLGGRVPRIRCDAPAERQHLQGNPQMMSNQMREDRTTNHPDEVRGYEMRSSRGHERTKVGGVIGKQKIYL